MTMASADRTSRAAEQKDKRLRGLAISTTTPLSGTAEPETEPRTAAGRQGAAMSDAHRSQGQRHSGH